MELIIGILGIALIIGLFLRKKGDNTMDTLSQGCGCLIVAFILLLLFGAIYLL